ncbi:MAG TPA: hypothetical protein VFF27_05505 [Bacteroidia bacterium]|jgi:hypothetical protein|nr:hypothetical protein [Bacteroidia bacterium]
MKIKSYPLTICKIEDDEDVVFIEYCQNLKIDLSSANEIVANRLEFMGDKKHYAIMDATNVKSISKEARAYLLDPSGGTKNILGCAIIASNPVASLLANIMIKSTKTFPSKFFHKKSDAIKWILELKEK